jgi:hypothetical protein
VVNSHLLYQLSYPGIAKWKGGDAAKTRLWQGGPCAFGISGHESIPRRCRGACVERLERKRAS